MIFKMIALMDGIVIAYKKRCCESNFYKHQTHIWIVSRDFENVVSFSLILTKFVIFYR